MLVSNTVLVGRRAAGGGAGGGRQAGRGAGGGVGRMDAGGRGAAPVPYVRRSYDPPFFVTLHFSTLYDKRPTSYPHEMTELSHQFVDMPLTPSLVIEDALGLFADDELCMRHNITLGTLTSLRVLPGYEAAKRNAREEIVEKNLTFKYKARLQAEQGLSLAWKWMNDPEAPVKDKLAVLKELTNWGELAPKETAGAGN